MELFPPRLKSSVRRIGEEVRQFVMETLAYYGVTRSGFLFNIIQCKTLQPPVKNPNDFHTYMWAECARGFYVLRQHFIDGKPGNWYLEAELIPAEKSGSYFQEMSDYFSSETEVLKKVCGPPHRKEEPILQGMEYQFYVGGTLIVSSEYIPPYEGNKKDKNTDNENP